MADNVLYYGDNLDVLRRHIKDESVDLIYLDPPFNSNATYNVLFAEHSGAKAANKDAQGNPRGFAADERSFKWRRRAAGMWWERRDGSR